MNAPITITRRILPVICIAAVSLAGMPAAQAGTFELVPNTTPTPVEINGKRYVIIKKDGKVSFKVAEPEGLVENGLKWKFTNASPAGDKSGVGPHEMTYDKEAGWGAVNPVQIEVKRKVGDQNCNTPFKRVAAVVVPMIDPDTGQAGTNGDMVPSNKGATGEKHYVSPKKDGEFVTFKAKFGSEFAFGDALEWEGGEEVAGSPEKRKVSRAATGKTVLKIKRKNDGVEVATLNVWIVWATISETSLGPITSVRIGSGNNQRLQIRAGGFDFVATVSPQTLFTDTDFPDLRGGKQGGPPGGNNSCGDALTGGADKKWDISRRIRVKQINPHNISPIGSPACLWTDRGYPADEVVGNDDASVNDPENNDPYSSTPKGQITGHDSPRLSLFDNTGNDGDTVEVRVHFGEFIRLEINGKWFKISDFFDWRNHFKFKKTNGLWVDDGTLEDTTNNGW